MKTTLKFEIAEKYLQNPGELFRMFKKLEQYVKDNFVDVEDFKCNKPFRDNIVYVNFDHKGKKEHIKELNTNIFSFVE